MRDTETKNAIIQIRVSQREKELLEAAARSERRTMSAYILKAAVEAAEKTGCYKRI